MGVQCKYNDHHNDYNKKIHILMNISYDEGSLMNEYYSNERQVDIRAYVSYNINLTYDWHPNAGDIYI